MGSDSMRIVTLVENTAGVHKGLRSEHGLAFYVETRGKSLLFDTGQTNAFLENAEKLRIDLSNLDVVCISHGHYDHSGGMRSLLRAGVKPPVWMGKGFFEEKYTREGTTYEYVGNDFDATYFQKEGVEYREVDTEVQEILPGVYAVSRFERIFPDETINPRFWVLREGRFEQDTFRDEILLVLDTPKGLVVLLGCSHPGVKNMLSTVRKRFPSRIHAILGGTHMVEAIDESRSESIEFLAGSPVERVGVCHCTGEKASREINERIEGSFTNHTGSMLWIM
ncbi:MAG: MBL fold metallo-hydrolase [Spirochaetales bacterium]